MSDLLVSASLEVNRMLFWVLALFPTMLNWPLCCVPIFSVVRNFDSKPLLLLQTVFSVLMYTLLISTFLLSSLQVLHDCLSSFFSGMQGPEYLFFPSSTESRIIIVFLPFYPLPVVRVKNAYPLPVCRVINAHPPSFSRVYNDYGPPVFRVNNAYPPPFSDLEWASPLPVCRTLNAYLSSLCRVF